MLELKDKISSESLSGAFTGVSASSSPTGITGSDSISEALEALMVLGYSQGEAMAVLGKLDPALSTQDLIKETLRLMTAGK